MRKRGIRGDFKFEIRPFICMMAGRGNRIAPELEQFIVTTVQLTGEVLGTGAYGNVEEVKIPGARIAAKKLHAQLVDLGSPQQVEKWVNDFVEECKLMSQLRHPNIVQFLGVCYLPGAQLPVLLMEKLQTSLDRLLETNPNLPIDLKVHLLTGTGQGVVFLHSRTPPIAHRDLSAKNILVDNGFTAKIADMGVSRIVNIRPGRLAATMTQMPGTGVYMPPEVAQEEGVTRYNTAIDIFSFGVVSLFTMTQTFPKDVKPATYYDLVTGKIVGRSEIERREDYIVPMKVALGETHPLVLLTLNCLQYRPEDRPTALTVLEQLVEVATTLPQNCTLTKLELIQQVESKDNEVNRLQAENETLQADNREQIHRLEQQTTELEAQRKEIDRLSRLVKSTQPQEQGQRKVTVAQLKPQPRLMVPSSITFKWKSCKDRPNKVRVFDQPVAINRKLYMRGESSWTDTVLVYTPDQDHWDRGLPPPPVKYFAIATLRGRLLVVGGENKSTEEKTDTILTFNESSQQWDQSLPHMPKALTSPAVVGYQNHLIVIGGKVDSYRTEIADVNILDTISNKWIAAEPLPSTDGCKTCLIGDTLYLVGQDAKEVFQAYVPSLISRASSNVWESVASVPFYRSSPVAISNTLLTVGGTDMLGGSAKSNIQLYDPTKNQWKKHDDNLPLKVYDCLCVELSHKLYMLGGKSRGSNTPRSVYTSILSIST